MGYNPDLVFQSRVKDYSHGLLEELLYKDRSLVDGWDKEMSVYLTEERPYFSRVRSRAEESSRRVLEHRKQEEVLSYLPLVTEELKKRGPLGAGEIKLGACQKNRWGHRQISGAALDYLNAAGRIGVFKKINTRKIYGLIEDLLPKKILDAPDPFSDDDEFLEWYISRRIGSMGAYWLRNGSGWLGHFLGDSKLRERIVKALEEKKLVVCVNVPEISEAFYVRRKDLSLLGRENQYDGAVRILAPLDNMLWDRLLVQKVFDFKYTWEVYVPPEKRKYGYYVLPVLYRNSLIARFEPGRHENGKPLEIKAWWWEPGINTPKTEIKEAVKMGLDNFARYLGAGGVDKKSAAAFLAFQA